MHVTVEQITDIDAGKGETLGTGSDAYSLFSFWKEKRKRMTLLRYAQMKRFPQRMAMTSMWLYRCSTSFQRGIGPSRHQRAS